MEDAWTARTKVAAVDFISVKYHEIIAKQLAKNERILIEKLG